MTSRAANMLMLVLALWGGGVACAKPVIVHRAQATEQLAANSLRPVTFPSIPQTAIDAGFFPNDLSTSVRTNVTPTTRAAVVEIAAGSYSSSFVHTLANRTIRLMGNVTFEGCGIDVRANNVTVDLNGFTLTFKSVGMDAVETGVVVAATDLADAYPTITETGFALTGDDSHWTFVVEFTSGAESGNFYEVKANTTSVITLENHSGGDIDAWQNGGPSAGNTFRIYDPRKTCGVTCVSRTGIEVVNGFIVEGAGFGRGSSIRAGSGCNPIFLDDTTAMVGGVSVTWHADNAFGIRAGDYSHFQYFEEDDQGTVVTNRQRTIGAIVPGSDSLVEFFRIKNHRHAGANLAHRTIVRDGEIFGDSRATNAYGVGTFGGSGNELYRLNIYKVGEHPICIAMHEAQGYYIDPTVWCEAQTTRPSSEYDYNFAVGLSVRWTDGVHTLPSEVGGCYYTYGEDFGEEIFERGRGKTFFFGALGNSAGVRVDNAHIGAISLDGTTPVHCIGLSVHNDQVVFGENVSVASNHNLYWIGDNYGPGTSGARFIGVDAIRIGSLADYKPIMTSGYWDTNVDFISCGGVLDDPTNIGQDELGFAAIDSGNVFRGGYRLTVTVTDGGSPVSGATVNVKDKDGNTLRSGFTTDGSGQVVVDVPTFYRRGPGFGSTTLSPLTVEAVKDAKDGTNTISPTGDDSISVGIVP